MVTFLAGWWPLLTTLTIAAAIGAWCEWALDSVPYAVGIGVPAACGVGGLIAHTAGEHRWP